MSVQLSHGSPIITTTVGASIDRTSSKFSGLNFSNEACLMYCEHDNSEGDASGLIVGNFLSYGLGDELVVNGGFEGGLPPWVSNTGFVADGIFSNSVSAYAGFLSQPIAVSVGNRYKITINIISLTNQIKVGLGDNANGDFSDIIDTVGIHNVFIDFTNTSAPNQVHVLSWDNPVDIEIDSLFVQQINTNANSNYQLTDNAGNTVSMAGPAGVNKVAVVVSVETEEITPDAFVTVWRTTTVSESVTLPATGTNDFQIDWGDGTVEQITSASPSHVYAEAGDYQVIITGVCPIWFQNNTGDKGKLIEVQNLGDVGWEDLGAAFYGCSNLIKYTNGTSDTTQVYTLHRFMQSTSGFVSPPDVSNFDTSNVTDMGDMFNGLVSILTPPDLSNFDTSKVTNMRSALTGWHVCTTPPDVSNFNTSEVTSMRAMFDGLLSILTPPDVSNFDTSKVTSMAYMLRGFRACTTPIDVSNFDTSKVTSMSEMFSSWYACTTPPDVSNFDTSKVTNMSSMFDSWKACTVPLDLSNFDTSKVTSMSYMFRSWTAIGAMPEMGIAGFDVSSLTTASDFAQHSKFTTAAYDAILIAWAAQTVQPNVDIHFGTSQYTLGGAAEAARNTLTSAPNNWIITDGGGI